MSGERIFKYLDGSELIETEEKILFVRSRPEGIPILTDANTEIESLLNALYEIQKNGNTDYNYIKKLYDDSNDSYHRMNDEYEGMKKRIEHLEQSLKTERDFALQWDGISTAYRIEKALNKELD